MLYITDKINISREVGYNPLLRPAGATPARPAVKILRA